MSKINFKNEELWKEYVSKNKDPYGAACVKVAKRVMEKLDEDQTPLHNGYYPDVHTAHGLICIADDETKAGGITGFMASVVAQMVYQCHQRGEEFKDSHNGDIKADSVVNHAILTIKINERGEKEKD